MAVTPAIRRLLNEAMACQRNATDLLTDVSAHARRYGTYLTFRDALDLVQELESRQGETTT